LEAFKPGKIGEDKTGLARILFDCKPIEYRIFPGWKLPISHVREFGKLPKEARNYISFLESEEGLDVPVSIISVGERSDQKFLNNPLR
jgi:adenylosuccinate synthase